MARKFYTCIIVPDSSKQLHKLRIPVRALYVLSAIGLVSFFVVVSLGFKYVGMVTRAADYAKIEAENARLRIDTKQLQISTHKLNLKITALEDQTEKITHIFETDALFRNLGKLGRPAGGTRNDLSTAELIGSSPKGAVESMRTRMVDLENQLSVLEQKTEMYRSTPATWPLQGHISSHYGSRLDPFTGGADMHLGIDIVAPFGSPVRAPADGLIIFSERKGEYGNLIVLQHARGLTTRYGHLSKYNVRIGQTVHRGEIIGYVGVSGRTTAPHLHYEVRLNDRPENPRKYLRFGIQGTAAN